MTREQGQSAVVDAYNKHGHLLVLYATGFGKAKASLDAVSQKLSTRGIIVCHSEVSRDVTWPNEIEKWNPGMPQTGQVLRVCYQSLKSLPDDMKYDWAIVDEAHFLTDNYMEFFRNNTIKTIILLTAIKPTDPIKKQFLKELSQGNEIKISLDDAVASGVLNDYMINIWYIHMTPLEKSVYLKHCDACSKAFFTKNSNFINMKLGERMRFIYDLESKYQAAVYLRDQIRQTGRRNIIFCGSIKMANRISPYRYHSQVGDTDYLRFLNSEISELASLKQIQEGANIPNLESALVVQLNSKQINIAQKLGRLMRLGEGMIARMHILIVKDTVDENWERKALTGLDPAKIKRRPLDPQLWRV